MNINNLKNKINIEIILIILTTALIMMASSIVIYESINHTKSYTANNIEKFNIYYQDSDYNKFILSSVEIDKNNSIKEKLQIIANKVSKEIFDNKKIKVLKVENNIAYIDLIDYRKDKIWYNDFQGSTGASCTAYALLENFLQEDYKGDWIDGVYFTYNGEIVFMEHMGEDFFGHIIYRNPKQTFKSNVPFNYIEYYIDINDYIIEDYYDVDINLDGIYDGVLLIHKGEYQSIYNDPMIYIVDGESDKVLTIIPINPFNPRIDTIEDLNGDGVVDISIKFNPNGSESYSKVVYEYENGSYVAEDIYTENFNIYASASSYFSSEFYDSKNISYKPQMVLDSRPRTSWIEGVYGDGIGEWIRLDFDKIIEVDNIYILNGLGDVTGNYYFKNNRIKTMLLQFSDGEELVVELEDNFIREQEINIGKKKTSYIKFTILDIYGGSKYDDTCIGSISINNPRIHNYSLENNINKQY